MKLTKQILIQVIFFLLTVQALSAADWELAKNKNGVVVHTREVENSPLKEFRGKVLIQASTDEALALITNPSTYTTWLHDCKSAEKLKINNKNEWYVYLLNGAPWPVSNRDVIFKANLSSDDKGTTTIQMKESSDISRPSPSGVVRIPRIRGTWMIKQIEEGKIEVVYQAHTDPGGSIPEFAANLVVVDIPYNTLLNLKNKLTKP